MSFPGKPCARKRASTVWGGADRKGPRGTSLAAYSTTLLKLIGANLLWIDDNHARNIEERRTLESLGVQIIISTSVADAKEYLRSSIFNLIISNWKLPRDKRVGCRCWKFLRKKQSAFTLLEELQENNKVLPFIIYSPSAPMRQISEAHIRGEFGFADNPRELFRLVFKLLGE